MLRVPSVVLHVVRNLCEQYGIVGAQISPQGFLCPLGAARLLKSNRPIPRGHKNTLLTCYAGISATSQRFL